ncbi:MAG: NERD domain-containing protein [Anaerolineae bacterium]|nr:NERD domain-containing protein [Anaerolineae bacterium]
MPIPAQNDFLQPFLTILGDGQTISRAKILYRLAKHFDISEEEAQATSGNQLTLVSRVAWCDVHFVKAGLVDKHQHHADSLQDEFRITSLGVRELRFRADKLTVGYLQSFYLGSIHRGAGSDDSTSDAELQLYEELEALTDEFEIFHSVKWFAKGQGTVGEADFLIAHPQRGVLVLEVKGGLIHIEKGEWYTTSRTGRTSKIQDPCEQADRSRRALRDWLNEDPRTSKLHYALFPAVALPDARVDRDIRPDCPEDIFIDMRHVGNLRRRLHQIFDYWEHHADAGNKKMDGRAAVKALVELLVPTRSLQPRIADIFERERQKIEELTQNQFRILRQLRNYTRAAIVGGAGTGKTMLAMEKAQQLADGGYRVLFLCFNRNLADWIGRTLKNDQIFVVTFHALVGHVRHWSGYSRGADFDYDRFTTEAPDILLEAASSLRIQSPEKLFDAIIVDEAQDFEDTWWIPLPDLLKDPEKGVFYVFLDDNQRLYQTMPNLPIETTPLVLSDNCRNTQHIHAQMAGYAITHDETDCLGPEGRPVEIIPAETPQAAKRELQRVLHRLVNEENIRSEDIVLLTPASDKRSQWKNDEQLGNFILTWNMDTEMELAIRICTIYRYKGLESAVVILTELNEGRPEFLTQLIYVGLSRARHHVVVIGKLPKP